MSCETVVRESVKFVFYIKATLIFKSHFNIRLNSKNKLHQTDISSFKEDGRTVFEKKS